MVICLEVRRFLCLSADCAKVTFAEQISGLTSKHARRTPALTAVLWAVALALGGRAGARLTGTVSGRGEPDDADPADPRPARPRRERVAEGAGRGRVRAAQGAQLRDSAGRCGDPPPVNILPERSADSFAAWLAARPGAELICRDRAGCYSDGGARGAPDAVQVADRWHLWHNLGEAVERTVSRHREYLPAAVAQTPAAAATAASQPPPGTGRPRTGRIADRTRARHAAVHRLLADGRNLSEIAAELGLSRNTVRRFARAASPGNCSSSDGTGRTGQHPRRARFPTCGSGGTPAAPTPRCCGRRSAPADTRAAAGRSAATSRASAEAQ